MHSIEPVNVAVAIMSFLLAPQLAEVIGPYAVIILASTLGASWSLGGKDGLTRHDAVWFFIKINTTAILITVAIANIISQKLGYTEGKWLLAPIALVIGIVGDDWGNLSKWVVKKIKGKFGE